MGRHTCVQQRLAFIINIYTYMYINADTQRLWNWYKSFCASVLTSHSPSKFRKKFFFLCHILLLLLHWCLGWREQCWCSNSSRNSYPELNASFAIGPTQVASHPKQNKTKNLWVWIIGSLTDLRQVYYYLWFTTVIDLTCLVVSRINSAWVLADCQV